jgi:hypothetical protein
MMQRIPSAFMVLSFALYTIIGTHYLLDDLDVTTATSEKIHTGNAFFIVIDILCVTVRAGSGNLNRGISGVFA